MKYNKLALSAGFLASSIVASTLALPLLQASLFVLGLGLFIQGTFVVDKR